MAASTFKFKTAQGFGTGLTVKAYTRDTDTLATNGTSSASTEGTNQKGTYTVTFTDLATGIYDIRIVTSADVKVASGLLNHTNAVGVEHPYLDLTGTYIAGINSGGTGTRSIVVTVNNGSTALANAFVTVTSNGVLVAQGVTNVSGQTTLNLNDGTYNVAISLVGHNFNGATLTVTSAATPVTYSMTAISVSAPANPSSTTGVLITLGTDNEPLAGVVLSFRQKDGSGTAGYSPSSKWFTVTSDADGLVEYTGFAREATYIGRRGARGEEVEFDTPDAASFNLPEILGAE